MSTRIAGIEKGYLEVLKTQLGLLVKDLRGLHSATMGFHP